MFLSLLIALCAAVLIFLAAEKWLLGEGFVAEKVKQLVGRAG